MQETKVNLDCSSSASDSMIEEEGVAAVKQKRLDQSESTKVEDELMHNSQDTDEENIFTYSESKLLNTNSRNLATKASIKVKDSEKQSLMTTVSKKKYLDSQNNHISEESFS